MKLDKRGLILTLKAILVERFFDLWDKEIIEDLENGKLDSLLKEAEEEIENAKTHPYSNKEFLEMFERVTSRNSEQSKETVSPADRNPISSITPF